MHTGTFMAAAEDGVRVLLVSSKVKSVSALLAAARSSVVAITYPFDSESHMNIIALVRCRPCCAAPTHHSCRSDWAMRARPASASWSQLSPARCFSPAASPPPPPPPPSTSTLCTSCSSCGACCGQVAGRGARVPLDGRRGAAGLPCLPGRPGRRSHSAAPGAAGAGWMRGVHVHGRQPLTACGMCARARAGVDARRRSPTARRKH